MADRTSSENEISRGEFASRLHGIADAFEDGEAVDVDVENKTISLRPPDTFEHEITVGEDSSMMGSDSERITIEANWPRQERSRTRTGLTNRTDGSRPGD